MDSLGATALFNGGKRSMFRHGVTAARFVCSYANADWVGVREKTFGCWMNEGRTSKKKV